MNNIIYYFIFENDYMSDIIDALCNIFDITKNDNSRIYKDNYEQVYLINAGKKGIACILADKGNYIYSVYIFSRKDYRAEITDMLCGLCDEIEEQYGDDRRIYTNPIDKNSDMVNDCIRTAVKFGYYHLLKDYIK